MARDDGKAKRRRCTAKTLQGRRCAKLALDGETRCTHHLFAVPGRPSKLTNELTMTIVYAVLEGNYLETAAQAAGVSPSTLYRWLRRADDAVAKAEEMLEGEDGEDAIYNHADPADWPYLDFRHALKSAEAFAETELLRLVREPGQTGPWQAFMTILERRHPTRWGRRDAHRVEHAGEVRRTVELIVPVDEDRAAVIRRLQEAGALDDVAGDENTTTA